MEVYEEVYRNRIAAKKAGDKTTANALKLILNTTYGAQLNRFNDLYDPLMARSVCISGQLYLLELVCHLMKDVPGLIPVNLNTDGLMVEFDEEQYPKVLEIVNEWQKRTGFTLEEDKIDRYYAKDCNNYLEITDGNVKAKGGYLVRGIAPAGAFNINNNAVIVAEAIKECFVNGTPPEETILACDDVSKFQQIAKAGAKYREAYHEVNGKKLPVQKVNRVYAAKDPRYGRIYKVKTENEMVAKIEMLPEHCLIDNVGTVTIDQIDKRFYVDMARKRINDFLGIKPEKGKKKMATAKTQQTQQTPMTALQKLLKARVKFLESGAKKSGMNSDIEFLYFELKDIVPIATPIFAEVGLLPVVWMDKEMAYMDMINTDDAADKITFSIPLAQWTGNRAVNPIQVIGATVTYYRRYLYQIALDIVEQDEIDNKPQSVLTDTAPAAETPRPPATPQERTEIKAELTAPEGQADALQLSQLKKMCKALKDAATGTERQGEIEEFLGKLAVATKGFQDISKDACAKVLTKIAGMMEEFQN